LASARPRCFFGLELVKDRDSGPLVPFNAAGDAAKPIAPSPSALDRGLYLMTHWNVVMCCRC
jgi:taurine--2-oxoglutarate transaminase